MHNFQDRPTIKVIKNVYMGLADIMKTQIHAMNNNLNFYKEYNNIYVTKIKTLYFIKVVFMSCQHYFRI